jgi:vacuolar-type H+-ATPase subunit D/Vma8
MDLDEKVSNLENKVQGSVGDAKIWLDNELTMIKDKKSLLEVKMDELKQSKDNIWEEIKNSIDEIESSISNIYNSIKEEIAN